MKRRHFFSRLAAVVLLPLALSNAQAAAEFVDYEPGLIKQRLAAGETLLVDYAATWCSTCARQARVIESLRAENPVYDEQLTFVKVDWDTYQNHEVTTSRNIPRRSTLLVLKDDKELGRIVAGTAKEDIKALLDKGL